MGTLPNNMSPHTDTGILTYLKSIWTLNTVPTRLLTIWTLEFWTLKPKTQKRSTSQYSRKLQKPKIKHEITKMPLRLSKSRTLTPKNLSKFHFNPKTFQQIHFDPIILQNYISISKLSKITFQLKNFTKSHFNLENFHVNPNGSPKLNFNPKVSKLFQIKIWPQTFPKFFKIISQPEKLSKNCTKVFWTSKNCSKIPKLPKFAKIIISSLIFFKIKWIPSISINC